ncbi:MAG: SEL1-like repeat protein [Bacteroidales bacterium]|nr:SEL1-like repeat protein [Bacteroidales bacterium]
MNNARVIMSLMVMVLGTMCMVYGDSNPGNLRKNGENRQYMRKKDRVNKVRRQKSNQTNTSTGNKKQAQKPKADDKPTYSAELQKKAESGDATAQLNLALCYDSGSGVEKNLVEAHKWFLKAAEQGNGRALNAVGNDYANGVGGVEKDLNEAIKWYRKSAEQGNDRGQGNMGWCYEYGNGVEKDLAEAVKWYRKSAEQGNAISQRNLGVCYEIGKGVEKDLAEAVKWYRKSAEQGNALGQNDLGRCYTYGNGVERDMAEAVKWYRKSAEQSNADSQFRLGTCYLFGIGVEKDQTEAVKWYHKAAEQGNADAQVGLASCYGKGLGVEKNLAEAAKWCRKSAEQGNALGQFMLGACYFQGDGVKEDIEEAFKWLSKAAKQGNEGAKKFLEKPEFSFVRVARGSLEDIEAGEVCLQKLKEFKKDGRFGVATPAPRGNDILVVKGLYIGMPVDDAVVACGKIAASSEDYVVVDSRMLKDEKWSQYKYLKDKMKGYDGVCVFSCKGSKNIQDAMLLCVARLDGNGNVRQIFFTRTGIDEIFKARKLSTEEFVTALADNYKSCPSLNKKVRDKRENDVDIREYRWTCSTRAYNIEVYENTLIVQGREINLYEYRTTMANDPNALGVAFGESLFDKYFCIEVNAKKSAGAFD